jgi:hypothetical protein
MNIYVIHSKSERGFWSCNLGWVYSIDDEEVTKYTEEDRIDYLHLPLSKDNDAEWVVFTYGE